MRRKKRKRQGKREEDLFPPYLERALRRQRLKMVEGGKKKVHSQKALSNLGGGEKKAPQSKVVHPQIFELGGTQGRSTLRGAGGTRQLDVEKRGRKSALMDGKGRKVHQRASLWTSKAYGKSERNSRA